MFNILLKNMNKLIPVLFLIFSFSGFSAEKTSKLQVMNSSSSSLTAFSQKHPYITVAGSSFLAGTATVFAFSSIVGAGSILSMLALGGAIGMPLGLQVGKSMGLSAAESLACGAAGGAAGGALVAGVFYLCSAELAGAKLASDDIIFDYKPDLYGPNVAKPFMEFARVHPQLFNPPDDGACLYHVVANARGDTSAAELRQDVVAYMRAHANSFRHLFESRRAFSRYLAAQAEANTWGDQIVIRALTDMLGIRIEVAQVGLDHLLIPGGHSSYGEEAARQIIHIVGFANSHFFGGQL